MIRENKVSKTEYVYSVAVCVILVAALMLIMLRFFVKNVLYDRMGMTNGFVEFCLKDEDRMGINQEKIQGHKKNIDWEGLYPFETADSDDKPVSSDSHSGMIKRAESKIRKIEDKADLYTNYYLIGRNGIVSVNERLKDITGWNLYNDAILMNNGYAVGMSRLIEDDEIDDIVGHLAELRDHCDTLGIPVMYMHMAGKVDPTDSQIDCYDLDHSNENADRMLDALKEAGIDCMDSRESLKGSDRAWYDYFYKTDGHWNTAAQLCVTGKLADRLNTEYGFDYDLNMFDGSRYEVLRFEDNWGGKGRTLEHRVGRDDFELIMPDYPTGLSYTVPSRGIDSEGTYQEVLLTRDPTDRDKHGYREWMNYYNAINVINDPLETFCNSSSPDNADKRVLLISDSFAWYLVSYLACDTGYVDKLFPPEFTGSIRTYIEQTKPDIVIVAYNIGQAVDDGESDSAGNAFDFR